MGNFIQLIIALVIIWLIIKGIKLLFGIISSFFESRSSTGYAVTTRRIAEIKAMGGCCENCGNRTVNCENLPNPCGLWRKR